MWELWPVVNWMSIMCTINICLQHSFCFSPCACAGLGHILQNMWYIWWKRDVFCDEVRIELKGLELSFCPPPWTLDHRWPLSFKISKTIETDSWALKKIQWCWSNGVKTIEKPFDLQKVFRPPVKQLIFIQLSIDQSVNYFIFWDLWNKCLFLYPNQN